MVGTDYLCLTALLCEAVRPLMPHREVLSALVCKKPNRITGYQ